MAKMNVTHLHNKLTAADIPIDGIALDRPGKPGITIDFREDATLEQRAEAQAIVDAYDPDAEAGTQVDESSIIDEINNAKTLPQLKEALIKHYNLKG